jgi:hypothetical protein
MQGIGAKNLGAFECRSKEDVRLRDEDLTTLPAGRHKNCF